MLMNDKLDEGDILDIQKIPLNFDMTVKDLIDRLKAQGPRFLTKVLWEWWRWRIQAEKQDDTQATLCGKIEKEDGLIDIYNDDIETVYQKYKAYILWPKIYFMHHDKRVIIEEMHLDETLYQKFKNAPLLGMFGNPAGDIQSLNPCITSLSVKPEGKKKMTREAFTRGYKM